MEIIVFCNLIIEVTSSHFYHIPFIISKSLDPVHSQGKGMTQECVCYWAAKDHWEPFEKVTYQRLYVYSFQENKIDYFVCNLPLFFFLLVLDYKLLLCKSTC